VFAAKDDADLGRRARELLQFIDYARTVSPKNYDAAFWAIHSLLMAAGMNDAREWFMDFWEAYTGLRHGRLDPILTPKKTANRPPDPRSLWDARADVAAAAKLLSKVPGMTRQTAAEAIARDFPQLKHLGKPGATLATSISSWRDQFGKNRVKNKSAQSRYEDNLVLDESWLEMPASPQERIELLLEQASGKARRWAKRAGS
jgi:hypothetical protein